jgi:hypothetical protein
VEAFLCRSFLFERARGEMHHMRTLEDNPKPHHQMSAKLHCLYGKPILKFGRTRSTRTYPFACSKVYDLRQYTQRTMWGPFLDDGTGKVDWEKVEAILIVLGKNIRQKHLNSRAFSNSWATPFSGSWSGSYMPLPERELAPLDMQDPYGVAGAWLRVRFTNASLLFRSGSADGVPRLSVSWITTTFSTTTSISDMPCLPMCLGGPLTWVRPPD